MKILLISKDGIKKNEFDKDIDEKIWLNDYNENKIIQVEKYSDSIVLKSNSYSKIINPNKGKKNNKNNLPKDKFLEQVKMTEGETYLIYYFKENRYICIFLSKDKAYEFEKYSTINKEKNISIGNSEKNEIIYKNGLISEQNTIIYKEQNTWYIENRGNKFGTFVNYMPVLGERKKIFYGDIIFIMGLKIVIINDDIYINNPMNRVIINKNIIKKYNEDYSIEINNVESIEDESDYIESINYWNNGYRTKKRLLNEKKVRIEPPPQSQKSDKKPIILTLGPTIIMGFVMAISMFNFMIKNSTKTEKMINIITIIAMVIGMVLFPIIDSKYEDRKHKKYLRKRKEKYIAYLNKKKCEIEKLKEEERQILNNNYIAAYQCSEILMKKDNRLWEREVEDEDFMDIRLGIGSRNFDIDITENEPTFTMEEEDELLNMMNLTVEQAKVIDDVPIIMPLKKNKISAFISKDNNLMSKLIKNVIIQLITFQSYTNLKLVIILDECNSINIEAIKMLPHIWDDLKKIRFFADNAKDALEISQYLNREFQKRKNKLDKEYYTDKISNYLIITNNYAKIKELEIIDNICNSEKNYGFSLLCLADDLSLIPKKTNSYLQFNENEAKLYSNFLKDQTSINFKLDELEIFLLENINKQISNIPIKIASKGTSSLPLTYSFLEMYNVENIEQLNIYERWKKNNTIESMKAPIGVDSDGKLIYLDIHENAHGPHGLIAGSTGSGKSEFIITYILSLIINYHPDDISLLLVDYKGGGLAGAFERMNIKVPHIVGTITNLNKNELQRQFVSINSELKRRQVLFNKAKEITNESTIDIYKYQKYYHDGVIKEAIPHLVIVCDEFAELKQQQPDVMEELVSVSRIGRSLGVHLILATQKPAGVVNDQITSNSKFGICLKVKEQSDSMDIIKKTDAAYLQRPGQFYLQVGNNEYFVLGQSRMVRSWIYSQSTNKKA